MFIRKLTVKICLWLTGTDSTHQLSSTYHDTDHSDELYPGHIQTNLFQKMLLSVGSSAVAITRPWRGGMQLQVFTTFMGICSKGIISSLCTSIDSRPMQFDH